MITPEDREKYKYCTDETILSIKCIGALADETIEHCMNAIHTNIYEADPKLEELRDQLSDANPRWIYGQLIEEAYDRDLINEIQMQLYRNIVGL